MMKKWWQYFLMFGLLLLLGCQKEAESPKPDGMSRAASPVAKESMSLDDFEEKDESCDTEEDLLEKIEEAKKEQKAMKLQGNDEGCAVN